MAVLTLYEFHGKPPKYDVYIHYTIFPAFSIMQNVDFAEFSDSLTKIKVPSQKLDGTFIFAGEAEGGSNLAASNVKKSSAIIIYLEMKKRIISLVLCIVFITAFLPNNVFAESTPSGTIYASPFLCPIVSQASGGTGFATTSLTWSTINAYNVSVMSGNYVLGIGASGTVKVTFNYPGTYVFYVYRYAAGSTFSVPPASARVTVYEQKGTLIANPNPVEINADQTYGYTNLGIATTVPITRLTQTINNVDIVVGTITVPTYIFKNIPVYPNQPVTFKLYDVTVPEPKLLSSITIPCIQKKPVGTITASPQTVTVPEGQLGSTTLTWISTAPYVKVYVSENSAPEQLFTLTGSNGSGTATWIQGGSNYVSNLYSYINNVKGELFASVKVIGETQQSSVAFDINSTSFNHLTDSFQLNVTSSPPLANQPVEIKIWCKIDSVCQVYSDFNTYGSTNRSGSFIMTGTFDSSLIGDWKEQACIESTLSNEIYFTIY